MHGNPTECPPCTPQHYHLPGGYGPPVGQSNSQRPSHLVCGGCSTLLMYPSGASSVRCQRCSYITRAPIAQPESAQIVCAGCQLLLAYPRGSNSVRCSVCTHVTSVPQHAYVTCNGCRTRLMFPASASCVRCSVCNTITPANPPTRPPPAAPGPQAGPSSQQPPRPPDGATAAAAAAASSSSSSGPSSRPQASAGSELTPSYDKGESVGLMTIVIENPATLDEHGHEVRNIMIGVRMAA
jgi:LSD1 subclass zinc finger protein